MTREEIYEIARKWNWEPHPEAYKTFPEYDAALERHKAYLRAFCDGFQKCGAIIIGWAEQKKKAASIGLSEYDAGRENGQCELLEELINTLNK